MHSLRTLALAALCVPAVAQTGIWAPLPFSLSPSARFGASLCYDSARDRLVLVGGTNGSSAIPETWENDGTQWVLKSTASPSGIPNTSGAMQAVYDSVRQRTLAVMCDASAGTTQTWEWDGTTWTQKTPTQSPPGRFGFALAFDSVRGRVVLFGGRSGWGGSMSSDTWEWDGANWAQRCSGGPRPRHGHAMAFDASRGVTVLFGGHLDVSSFIAQYADTWEWNGSYWKESFGVAGPAPRSEHVMSYDSARQRTVLYGGRTIYFGSNHHNDTWEWDGLAWLNTQSTTPVATFSSLAFDTQRARTVLFGGRDLSGQQTNGTWAYTSAGGPPASVAAFGSGCAGPNGVPQLSVQLGSLPKLGSTFTVIMSGMPTSTLNVPLGWVGFDNATWGGTPLPLDLAAWGFPGCHLLIAPSFSMSLLNAGGSAQWPLTLPFLPTSLGQQFYLQGSVFVPGFNPGGFVFTPGLRATIGI